jgi:iron complex transport system substrate-binding protein
MERILSLVPAATEIVAALGLERLLVGRTHECDYPASILGTPIVTAPRLDPTASSAAIDQAVRTMAAANQSLFRLDEERIRALAPTLILTQGLCPVCAVDDRDVCRLAAQLPHTPTLFRMQPMTLEDLFADIANIGALLQCERIASQLLLSLKQRVSQCVVHASLRAHRPRVLLLEWLDPFFSAGHWNPQLIELGGGEAVLAQTGSLSRAITLQQIQQADPDLILLAPCGFSHDRAVNEAALLHQLDGWSSLRAVQAGRIHILDGSHYFNRPGPRLVDSLEVLTELIGTLRSESHAHAAPSAQPVATC